MSAFFVSDRRAWRTIFIVPAGSLLPDCEKNSGLTEAPPYE